MTERYDVAIIGAGHNGLTCAAYLAKAGRKVIVLEAGERVGGAAVTREFTSGFSVSACAHLLYMLHSRIVSELELERHGLELAAGNLSTIALSPQGGHLTLSPRRVEGEGLSATDRSGYPAFMDRLRRFARVLAGAYLSRPPRLAGDDWRDTVALARLALDVRRLGREDMRELLRIGAINIFDVLQEEFESELLKGAFGFDAVIGTHLGPRSPNTVLSLLHRIAGQVAAQNAGIGLPRGGMGTVSTALQRAAAGAGAEIRTNCGVARILVEHNHASGVLLENGNTVGARLVISNADPKATFLSLVGVPHIETGFARRIHNMRMCGNVAKLHLALDGLPEFTGLSPDARGNRLLIAPSLTFLEQAFDHCKYGEFSRAPALEVTIPSIHDAGLAPAGKHVLSAAILYAPYELRTCWDGGRDAFMNTAIDSLEHFAPGIRKLIVHAEILTPADIEREFRITGGHWHHGELALDQFMMLRPVPGAAQYATPIGGLYLCGAGAHPGGGVMGLPGRNAAREVMRREKAA